MTRILISGPPAAGKSTLAARLAEEHQAQLIDFDAIARDLGSASHHDHPDDVRDLVHAEIEHRIDALDGPAVVIRSAPRPAEREQLAARIEADRVIVLAVPPAEAKRRAEADGRPDWTPAAIDRWWARYEPADVDTETTPSPRRATVTTQTDPPEGNPPAPDDGDEFDPERAKAALAKKNQENASLRARLKEAEAKAARLDELEGSQKSELEKANERVANAERAAQEAELRALRLEIAAEKGLTAAQAKRLVGATREELEADYEAAVADGVFSPPKGEGAGTDPTGTGGTGEGNRQERVSGGTDPTDEPVNVKSIVDSIPPTA